MGRSLDQPTIKEFRFIQCFEGLACLTATCLAATRCGGERFEVLLRLDGRAVGFMRA